MRVVSLFTGAGGLDMAVAALWPHAELVWWSEVDPHASAVFARHHPDAPNLGDIEAIDWTDAGPVDVMFGGFPCQDISNAGKQAGIKEGTRSGLWFRFADGIRTLRPRVVLLENVAAIVANGGPAVVGSLANLGYDVAWTTVRASDVGCCHRRDRWFAVAYPHGQGLPERHGRGLSRSAREDPVASCGGGDVAPGVMLPTPAVNDMGAGKTPEQWDAWTDDMKSRHGNGNGHGKSLAIEAQRMQSEEDQARQMEAARSGDDDAYWQWVNRVDPPPGRAHDVMLPTPRVHADRTSRSALTREGHWSAPSLSQAIELASGVLPREYESWDEVQGWHGKTPPSRPDRWRDYADAIARWEAIHGPAPDPTDNDGRLSPTFVEWMMGWPDGWTAGATRAQRLKMLGNGVVPHQAVAAYSFLLDRMQRRADR